MFKQTTITALIALTVLAPAATFAKEEKHENNGNRGRQEEALRHKRRVDVAVALGGKVTVINGTMLTLVATNGSTYSIDASAAKFIRRFGGTMVLGDIQVNDQLFVTGSLTGTVVKAKVVQDLSLQARNGNFTGTVKSMSTNSFVLTSKNRGDQTINVSSSTKMMKNGQPMTLADLTVGAMVHVDGVWDRTNTNVSATKIVLVVKAMDVRLNGTVSASSSASIFTLTATDGKNYQVDTTKAQLIARNYFGTDMSKVRVGDTVQVVGKSDTASADVRAHLVVDFSL